MTEATPALERTDSRTGLCDSLRHEQQRRDALRDALVSRSVPWRAILDRSVAAASTSSGVRGTTVRTATPPAAMAVRATAAALSLSGKSTIVYTSRSPKGK